MKIVLLIVALLFFSANTFAQDENISELERKIEQANGKDKVDALNQMAIRHLSREYISITRYFNHSNTYTQQEKRHANPQKAYPYIQQAIPLAKSLDYTDGLAVAYFLEGKHYEEKKALEAAETAYLRWLALRKQQGELTKIRWAYEELYHFYYRNLQRHKAYAIIDSMYVFVEGKPKSKQRTLFYLKHQALKQCWNYVSKPHSKIQLETTAKHLTAFIDYLVQHPELDNTAHPLVGLRDFFEYEIIKKLKNQEPQAARDLGEQWLASRATFKDDQKYPDLTLIARKIGKYFFTKGFETDKEIILFFMHQSVNYAKKTEAKSVGENFVETAYWNACYYAQETKSHQEALAFALAAKTYSTDEIKLKSVLNTCATAILNSNNRKLKQEAIQMITTWKLNLLANDSPALFQWCEDYLYLLAK